MCSPAALGVAQGAVQGVSAVGGFLGQSAQTQATNDARLNEYKNQLAIYERDWMNRVGEYQQGLVDYEAQSMENELAYNRATQQAQRQLTDVYSQAAFNQLKEVQGLQAAQGRVAASGVSGQSALRARNVLEGAYGQSQAISMDNLLRARYGFMDTTESLRNQLTSANRQSWNKVALAPTPGIAPPEPVFSTGPSPLTLFGELGSSALGGFSTYGQAKKDNWFG